MPHVFKERQLCHRQLCHRQLLLLLLCSLCLQILQLHQLVLMQLMVRNSAGWLNHLIALTMGVGMGLLATRVLRVIGQREADSLVRSDDLIGLEGVVTLAMDAEKRGFVELSVRGTLLRRPALSCEGALAANTKVVVVASDDHTLRVETLQPPTL